MQTKRQQAGKLCENRIGAREAAVLQKCAKQIQVVKYKFSSDGGAVGDISFGAKLPAGSVITAIYYDEISNVTSGGSATVLMKAGSTNIQSAATAFASLTGVLLVSPTAPIKLASEGELKMTIAVAALTAGELNIAVEFYMSEVLN